jgi:Tol biopolymer transport system component
MRRLIIFVASVGMALLGLTAVAGAAQAKVPGANGRIAFEQADPASTEGDTFVFTANPDGSDVQQLVPSHTCCASWSPDGSKISISALTDDERITTATVNPDGSDYEVKTIPDPTLNLGCAAWSPDGDRFACEGWDDVHPERAAGLFSVRTSDFGGLVRLTTNPYGGHDIPGDYSPDGTQIAFLRQDPLRPQSQTDPKVAVFVANSDGASPRQVTPWALTGCCKVSWSPDGTTLLFSNGKGSLFTVKPDGSDLQKIPVGLHNGPSSAFIAGWSPDGKRIGFTLFVQNTQQYDIYTMQRDGTDVVQVTNTPEFKEFDDWGPALPAGP